MPRVSIVLPNYNYARYLDERIASILGQSFRDFELIIVDDASSDESLEVISRYTDPRIRVHIRNENSGRVYASWNEGLSLCSGELVLFAGADDSAEATLLERLVEPFDRIAGLGLAHCRFVMVDADGAILRTQIPLPPIAAGIVESLERDYDAQAPVEWQRLLVTNFIWNASGVLMRTDIARDAGGFDTEMLIASDWLLYMAIARNHHVAYVAEPLNAFRQLEKSISKRLQGARLMDEVFDCLKRQEPYVDAESRPYLDAGLAIADGSLRGYLDQNRTSANAPEVEKLLAVREKYRREGVA